MFGRHLLSHWSSTQQSIALSSAEAELNAIVKGFSESLGVKNMFQEMEVNLKVGVHTDSSAANGIVHRTGCGKVKHLEAKQLWVQEYVEKKIVKVSKVAREWNPSDVLTHHWSAKDGYGMLHRIGVRL